MDVYFPLSIDISLHIFRKLSKVTPWGNKTSAKNPTPSPGINNQGIEEIEL